MEIWKTIIGLVCGASVIQIIFLGGLLGWRNWTKSKTSPWIALMLLGLGLRIGKSVFYYLLPKLALFGVVLGGVGLLLIGPAYWMYVKNSKGQYPGYLDYLHFLPALVVLILGSFFRMAVLIPAYHIGAFMLGVYLVAGIFWVYKKDIKKPQKGFKLITLSLGMIWLTFIFQYFSPTIEWYALGGAVSCVVLYVINFYIIRDQHLFQTVVKSFRPIPSEITDPLTGELETLFESKKVYRKKGLTIAMVAAEIDRPAYLVSKTINQHFGLKFNEYVNSYRVEEVKKHLQDLDTNQTVETIAGEVGFSSTSSLYQAFKKDTQLTLQQYRNHYAAQNA